MLPNQPRGQLKAVTMDSSRAAAMQMQLRHNAEDLQEFLRDLETWESEIKEKDDSLKKQKPILKETLPPVRSRRSQTTSSKKKTKKKAEQSGHPTKPIRITSYDYRGWDKFDVEKACDEVDYEVQSSSGSEDKEEEAEEEEEGFEEERKRQQALMEKEKGNALLKEGKLELAVECYTIAMELDPLSPVIPANRALALLKLERYAAAESDCSVSLALDDSYVKAFLRRGTARTKLGKLKEAKEDFIAVLKLEPGNKQAKSDVVKLEKQLKMSEDSSVVETQKSPSPYVSAVKRPPHLRSKKPLKHIVIEEVGEEEPMDTTASVQPKISGKAIEDPVGPSRTLQKEHNISASEESSCDVPDRVTAARSEVQDDPRREEWLSPVVSTRTSLDDPASVGHHIQVDEIEKAPQVPEVLKLPPVPDSCIQFQADWKSLRRNRNVLSQYFKALPLSKYPSLFQQSLETDIFPEIISLLYQEYVGCGKLCLEELRWLTKVKRFSVAVMFLSRKEKEGLHQLFKELHGLVTSDTEHSELRDLAKVFDVKL